MGLVGGFRGVLTIWRKENVRNGSSTSCVVPQRRENRASQPRQSNCWTALNSGGLERLGSPLGWWKIRASGSSGIGGYAVFSEQTVRQANNRTYTEITDICRGQGRHDTCCMLLSAVSVCQCQSRTTRQPAYLHSVSEVLYARVQLLAGCFLFLLLENKSDPQCKVIALRKAKNNRAKSKMQLTQPFMISLCTVSPVSPVSRTLWKPVNSPPPPLKPPIFR